MTKAQFTRSKFRYWKFRSRRRLREIIDPILDLGSRQLKSDLGIVIALLYDTDNYDLSQEAFDLVRDVFIGFHQLPTNGLEENQGVLQKATGLDASTDFHLITQSR